MKNLARNLLLVSLLWPAIASAQEVGLVLPDTTFIRGSTVWLPVRANADLTGLGVTAFELRIAYDPTSVDADSFSVAGTLLEGLGWTISLNRSVAGVLSFAAAGTTPLTGVGDLVRIRLYLKGFGGTAVDFGDPAHNLLNEGTPPVTLDNAWIAIQEPPTITLSPDAAILAVGEMLDFDAWSATPPVTWSTTDTSVASIDADGSLTALMPGFVRVIAEDSSGLRDTTNGVIDVRAIRVFLADTTVTTSSILDLAVSVSSLTAWNVTSGMVNVLFDTSTFQFISVITENTLLATVTPVINATTPGAVTLGFAGSGPLQGSGALFIIRLDVKNTGWASVTLGQALFNEDVVAKLIHASINVQSHLTLGVSPSEGSVLVGDTVQLYAIGGEGPYEWWTSDTSKARVDGDGHLVGVRSGIVTISVRDLAGAEGRSNEYRVYDGAVRIPHVLAESGVWVEVPLSLARLGPSHEIFSHEVRLTYDASVLQFDGLRTSGTRTENWSTTHFSAPPSLTIAGAATIPLTTQGDLVFVRFNVAPSLPPGTFAGIQVERMLFNEGVPVVDRWNGGVTVATVPGEVSLWSPGNGSTNLPVEQQLEWGDVQFAEFFEVQVSTDSALSTLVFQDSTITATTVTVGPLANGTVHFWRVRARNSIGVGPWSVTQVFRTVATLPSAPAPAEPFDHAVDVSVDPTLFWRVTAQAVSYHVQFSDDSTFETLIHDVGGIADTSFTPGTLAHMRVYYWRVRGSSEAGDGDWSSVWSFRTIIGAAGTPLLEAPASSSEGISVDPSFIWHTATDAATYQFQLSNDPTFTNVTVDSAGITDTTLVITGLMNLTTYHWRVRAVNVAGSGDWSPTWSFETIPGALGIPVLTEPPNGTTPATYEPTLVWRSAPYALTYDVQLAEDSLFTMIVDSAAGIPDTTFQTVMLQTGHRYYWRVRSINSTDTSAYCAYWWFEISYSPRVERDPSMAPSEFKLNQNHPNPFNPATRISFSIAQESDVQLSVFSISGVELEKLLAERLASGTYHVWWNANGLPTGVYLCRLTAGKFVSVRRMVLMK